MSKAVKKKCSQEIIFKLYFEEVGEYGRVFQ